MGVVARPSDSCSTGNSCLRVLTIVCLCFTWYTVCHCNGCCVFCNQTIMAVDVPGLVGVVVFYLIILVIGIWASRKSKKVEKACVGSKSEVAIVGGRNISVLVGVFTMTGKKLSFTFHHLLVFGIPCCVLFMSSLVFFPSLSATWVGGGYIMGTAEAVYSPTQGLIWAMGPPAYLINFLLGK